MNTMHYLRQSRWLVGVLGGILLLTARSGPHPQADAAQAAGAQPAAAPVIRFEARDVFIDSGNKPLAAYQFELIDPAKSAAVVGVEGGEHAAFAKPPYYDPAALTKGRLIVAAFSTAKGLPSGKTRVARVHLQITGEADPDLEVKVVVAANKDGEKIPVEITIEKREGR